MNLKKNLKKNPAKKSNDAKGTADPWLLPSTSFDPFFRADRLGLASDRDEQHTE